MNPSLKLFIVMFVGIELTFTNNIFLNLWVILLCLLFLFLHHINFKALIYLFGMPLLPAIGLLISQYIYGVSGRFFGWILFTRLYAYTFTGSVMVKTPLNIFTYSLEENMHLPSKVVYGVVSACAMVSDFAKEIQIIRVASEMRGITLHVWSPELYFKAIVAAFRWSTQLAEAMISHGFVENEPRTHLIHLRIKVRQVIALIIILVIVQIPLGVLK